MAISCSGNALIHNPTGEPVSDWWAPLQIPHNLKVIRKDRSGNVHPIFLQWNPIANEVVLLDTYQLISLLGIPKDHKFIIHHIAWTHLTTNDRAWNLRIDPRLGQASGTPATLDDADIGRMHFRSEVQDRQYERPMYGMDCIDELEFINDSNSNAWIIQLIIEYVHGNMRVIDDDGLRLGDVRQVTPDRTPGREYFQLGPITQIGQPGEDVP